MGCRVLASVRLRLDRRVVRDWMVSIVEWKFFGCGLESDSILSTGRYLLDTLLYVRELVGGGCLEEVEEVMQKELKRRSEHHRNKITSLNCDKTKSAT